ncbi:hypothetical protein [Pseudoprevotella muciniphila]|nr:hypothetical protein [Pseudoprevotella muciniphila]
MKQGIINLSINQLSKSSLTKAQLAVVSSVVKAYITRSKQSKAVPISSFIVSKWTEYQITKDPQLLRFLLAFCIRIHHGQRMPWLNTYQAVLAIEKSGILSSNYSSFEDLYDAVKCAFKGIPFAQGNLTVYDTARNLALFFGNQVSPKDYVYLAAGAKEGAEALLGPKIKDFRIKVEDFESVGLYPALNAEEIEDLLCVYKSVFVKMRQTNVTNKDIDDIDCCCGIPQSLKDNEDEYIATYLKKMHAEAFNQLTVSVKQTNETDVTFCIQVDDVVLRDYLLFTILKGKKITVTPKNEIILSNEKLALLISVLITYKQKEEIKKKSREKGGK